MRNLLICLIVLCFLISIPLAPALAEREVKIQPADPAPTLLYMGELGVGDPCQTGNLNPGYWAIGNWSLPPEEYKLAFDPITDGDCGGICAPLPGRGIEINKIYIWIQVDAACSIVMSVDVEEVTYPTSPDCPEPGPVACTSPSYQVDLPSAGGWHISLPIENCGCLTVNRNYMLSVHFESTTSPITLVTDNIPTNCRSWNNWGTGWVDLVADHGFPGNLAIWADAVCCEPPVPVEMKSWGVIKNLYTE